MKFIDDSSARSLGDPRLFESYFVCVEEALDGSKTTITYGKTPDNRVSYHLGRKVLIFVIRTMAQ